MNENIYKDFKKTYQNIQPPEYLSQKGWEDLSLRLPVQDKPRISIARYSFLFAALLLLLTAGVVGAAQTAQPGTILYSVKEASDHVNKAVNELDTTNLSPKKIIPAKPPLTPTAAITPTIIEKKTQQTENKTVPTTQKSNNSSQNGNSQNKPTPTPSLVNKQQVQGAQTERGNSGNNGNNNSEQKTNNSGQGSQKKN